MSQGLMRWFASSTDLLALRLKSAADTRRAKKCVGGVFLYEDHTFTAAQQRSCGAIDS